jgi:hypothetical protein
LKTKALPRRAAILVAESGIVKLKIDAGTSQLHLIEPVLPKHFEEHKIAHRGLQHLQSMTLELRRRKGEARTPRMQ